MDNMGMKPISGTPRAQACLACQYTSAASGVPQANQFNRTSFSAWQHPLLPLSNFGFGGSHHDRHWRSYRHSFEWPRQQWRQRTLSTQLSWRCGLKIPLTVRFSQMFPPPLPVDQTHYPPRDQLKAQLQSSPECPRHGQRPDNTTT